MSSFDNSSCYNRGRRTNPMQKQMLIAAMAKNRKILECRSGDSIARRARDAVWKQIMLELNMAGPEKHISEWRKVWTDLRLGMRKKWQKAQQSKYILTEYERRVIHGCGMIKESGDEDSDVKSAEDINSFIAFLEEDLIKEHESIPDHSDYFKEDNSNPISNYLTDSSEFIICQPTDIINIKEEEFDEEAANFVEYEEPSVELISDDEPTSRFDEFREPSVECISDEDVKEPMITNDIESPPHLTYEEPLLTEIIPRPIAPSPLNNTKLHKRKKLKDATLKEIKKMHRDLLKESKKQTALLRRIVRGMQQ